MSTAYKLAGVLVLAVLLAGCVNTPAVNNERAADANAALGMSYLRKGKIELALQKFQRALSYDQDHVQAHWGLALVYARLDEPERATSHFEHALDASTNPAILNSYAAFLCEQGRTDKAIEYFKRAVASPRYTHPEYALTNAGICLRRAGDFARAADFLKRALEQVPEYAPALAAMARLYYAQAEHFNARAYFQRLKTVGQLKDQLLLLAARNALALGNRAQAYMYLQRYNQSHPHGHWTLESLNPDD